MTYKTAQYLKMKTEPFSAGIVDNTASNLIEESQSPYARNIRLDGHGTKIRPGRTLLGTTGGQNVGGIGLYIRDTEANNRVIVRSDIDSTHKLASMDFQGNTTPINTGGNITSENFMNFTQGGDKVYCMNGQDPMGILSGTTYTSQTILSTPQIVVDHYSFSSGNAPAGTAITNSGSNNINVGSAVLHVGYHLYFTGITGSANIINNAIYYVQNVISGPTIGPGLAYVAAGNNTVVGTSTFFTKWFHVGSQITLSTSYGSETKTIATIVDDLNMTTVTTFTGAAGGATYTTSDNFIEIEEYPTLIPVTPNISQSIGFTTTNASIIPNNYIIISVGADGYSTPHGLKVGTPIQFTNKGTASDGSTGNITPPLSANQTYYVVSVPTPYEFTVSATVGGAPISFTDQPTPINTVNLQVVITPSFSTIFNGQHWVAGSQILSNYVSISSITDFSDFTTVPHNLVFNEPLTGLYANAQALFYFTNRAIYSTDLQDIQPTSSGFSYIWRPIQSTESAVSNRSIVGVQHDTYFLSPTNKIYTVKRIRSVYGFEVDVLSHRPYKGIDKFMDSLPMNQTQATAYYHPELHLIKWFLRENNSTNNTVAVVYDTNKDSFFIDTNVSYIDCAHMIDSAYAVSPYNQKVYTDEVGTNDENAPIPFFYATKHFDSGAPTMKKEFWEARTFVRIKDKVDLKAKVYVDNVLVNEQEIYSNTTQGIQQEEVYLTDVNGAFITDVSGNYITTLVSNPNPAIQSNNAGISTLPIGAYPVSREDASEPMQDIVIVCSKGDLRKRGRYIQLTYENDTLDGELLLQNIMIKAETLPPETLNRTDGL